MPNSVQKLRYHGTGGELLGLFIVNLFLTAITLGIYSFWAKARMRRYFYSSTELAQDRFAFHGTGAELLKGWLLGTAVMMGLVALLGLALALTGGLNADPNAPPSLSQIAVMLTYFAAIMCLVAIAINGARRYRLSRSSWRGIRFSFRGHWSDFLKLMVGGFLLTAVTLGLYGPYFRNRLRAFLVNHTRFGTMPFQYDGDGRDLFSRYLLSLLLMIPTLGIMTIWYRAFEYRYFWSHTTVGPARFQSTVTFGSLFGIAVTNVLLVVVTLGLGIPWAMTRWMNYLCDNIKLAGAIEWKDVQQQAQFSSSLAEGLAQGLDVNVDVGLGM